MFQPNLFNIDKIRNANCASNQHIRMMYEGSCDYEDWNNNAENSALHHRNTFNFKYIKTKTNITFF